MSSAASQALHTASSLVGNANVAGSSSAGGSSSAAGGSSSAAASSGSGSSSADSSSSGSSSSSKGAAAGIHPAYVGENPNKKLAVLFGGLLGVSALLSSL